jgi:uncharacterized protein
MGKCIYKYPCIDDPVSGIGGVWMGFRPAAFLAQRFNAALMELPRDAMLLRIFIGEGDELKGAPLYEKIVLRAREQKLAGATVLRGPMGFGKSSHLHTAKILRLSLDLPMVIEIVDSEEKIREFLPVLDGMIQGGLVTLERVQAIMYRGQQRSD